jgi:GDP-L-fucose synthase
MIKPEKILVTGGSGMIGNAVKKIIPQAIFLEREYDLRREEDTKKAFEKYRPEYVIHLAAKVGGLKANMEQQADFYTDNILINTNVIRFSHLYKVKKLVSLLSTCVYPDSQYVEYPLTEEQLHSGFPHLSNFGYSFAKRMVDIQTKAYRQQFGCNFITAIPNNLYGENDNFDLENGHVLPSLLRKIWEAKINNEPQVEIWGNGKTFREFTFSEDIAKVLLFLLENYNGEEPINIGNTQEYSIDEIAEIICNLLEYKGKIVCNTNKPTGQHRKPSNNEKLINLGWDKKDYTSLKDGLKKTCDWFKINYPNVRGC